MKKINKKMLISLASITSTIVTTIPIVTIGMNNNSSNINLNELNSDINQSTNNNGINNDLGNLNDANQQLVKPLIKTENNYFNPRLSTKNGPITYWGNTITSVDWFGASRWEQDVTKIEINGRKPFASSGGAESWKRNWLNFDLDKKKDILYILNNAVGKQSVVSIDTSNGKVLNEYILSNNSRKNKDTYFTLSVLENGNVLVFGQQGHAVSKSELINVKDGTITQNNGNLDKISTKYNNVTNNYLMNLIPIAENRNLAITYNFTNISGSKDDKGKVDEYTSRVDFILCDDKMNYIDDAPDEWKKPKLATDAITGTRNSAMWPQRDWYKLLDGRIVTIIYDKLFVIDGKTNSNNPTFTTFNIGNDKWIESWSFDTDEKLYFKIKNDTIIQTVTLDSNKTGNKHILGTYYDLKNSSGLIKEHASKFSLYNVYRYSGQIMIINSYWNDYIDISKMPKENDIKQNNYGLAAAITNNKSIQGQGDTKGLLNTENAFQKSADFSLSQDVLTKKLPSEITRNDLTLLNNSFFTQRTETNNNGGLIYEPFVKKEMDDKKKTLKIVVNIDQIPWFVTNNVMPNDIKPLRIEKSFTSTVNIQDRFIWKKIDIEDYDFKNTLPSKLDVNDINRMAPLISTLASQNVKIGSETYPKTTYSISGADDKTGSVKISAKYEYIPMDTKATNENVMVYELEKDFTIFNSNTQNKFSFVNNGNLATTQDINNIAPLKELKEANLFPSHFQNASKQEFLKFINVNETKGYPLEKMNISVEANDNNGTLKVIVDPTVYDSKLPIHTITYTGLNRKDLYNFSFLEPNATTFNRKQYKPSDINNEILYKHFLQYSGFDSSDLKVDFVPNNDNGSLLVNVSLNVDYPNEIMNATGFKKVDGKYKRSQTISGFKTNVEFNNEFQLNFKNDLDPTLIKVKELTPATIKAKITSGGLDINGEKYTNYHKLIELFISSKGANIPQINSSDTNITVDMFTNNSGGEITFSITFKNLPNYANPITFIQKFTGFAKGNDDITDDVLTFKDSNQLKISQSSLLTKMPSEVKKELEKNKSDIYKFLSGTPTGDYQKAIKSNDFELKIVADDNYGNLTINIIFKRDNIKNPKSLLEYSQTFEGFNYYK